MNEILTISNLSKSFGDNKVLSDINLTVNKGDIFGILGLSGAGKSTLVRCINGLENFDKGEIVFNDEKENNTITLKPKKKIPQIYHRKVATIFQHFNLLQQRTVLKNVSIVGELVKDKNATERAKELLELVGLSDKLDYYPSQLSGGQQQRVAIARALMSNPDILLSDEATSALDPETTFSILTLLKDLNKRLGLTIIMISHQMFVIERICNKVAVLDKSGIVESGLKSDLFLNPKTEITKKLVYSEHVNTKLSENGLIKIKFNGEVDSPVITNIIQDCNIVVSIVYASSQVNDGRVYGEVIIRLPYYDEDIAKLKKYFEIKNISYEEVNNG